MSKSPCGIVRPGFGRFKSQFLLASGRPWPSNRFRWPRGAGFLIMDEMDVLVEIHRIDSLVRVARTSFACPWKRAPARSTDKQACPCHPMAQHASQDDRGKVG